MFTTPKIYIKASIHWNFLPLKGQTLRRMQECLQITLAHEKECCVRDLTKVNSLFSCRTINFPCTAFKKKPTKKQRGTSHVLTAVPFIKLHFCKYSSHKTRKFHYQRNAPWTFLHNSKLRTHKIEHNHIKQYAIQTLDEILRITKRGWGKKE